MDKDLRNQLAAHLCDEWDGDFFPMHKAHWPEDENDDGKREGGYVAIQPKHVQARALEMADRILAFLGPNLPISTYDREALEGAASFFEEIATMGNPAPLAFSQAIKRVLASPQPAPKGVEITDRQVIELKMTPINEGLPTRDELRGEQSILTYNDKVGTWDIAFMEAGWDDFDAGFALGVTHWLDISEMWPGVIAQVVSFHSARDIVTDAMSHALIDKHREMWPGAGWPTLEDARSLVEAAMKEA